MVDEDIKGMYDDVIAYLRLKQAYLADPANVEEEFNDHDDDIDFTSTLYTIQRQIRQGGSIGEASTIKGYRDIHGAQQEYGLRLKKRADYWSDAAVEEQDNIDKWIYNQRTVNLHMIGKDEGS